MCPNCSDLRPGLDRDQLQLAEFQRNMAHPGLNPRETVHLAAGAAERLIAAGRAAKAWKRKASLAGMV